MRQSVIDEARKEAGAKLICTSHFTFDKQGNATFCANAAADAVIAVLCKHYTFKEKRKCPAKKSSG